MANIVLSFPVEAATEGTHRIVLAGEDIEEHTVEFDVRLLEK